MARPSLREKILESGVRTLYERGFAGAGVREISSAAGTPHGSFTNHFASKEKFAVAVIDRYFEQLSTIIDATLRNQQLSPLQRLRAYFDAVTDLLRGNDWRHGCLIGNLSLEAAEHSEVLREHLAETFAMWTRPFADAVRAAQTCGELRDDVNANELADVLLSAWHGAMLRMKVERSPEPLHRFKRVFFATLLSAK